MKDITNRYKLLQGHRIHYMPGWDCHGLPIEQKALTEMKGDFTVLEPLEIRAKGKIIITTFFCVQMFYVIIFLLITRFVGF